MLIDCRAILLVVRLDGLGGQASGVELQRAAGMIGSPQFRPSLLKCLDAKIMSAYSFGELANDKQLTTPESLYLKLSSYRKQLHKAVQEVVQSATDRRNFSAPYQAVVSGKKARKDPIQQAILKLHPTDRGAAWREFSALTDVEQAALAARLS